MQINAWIIPLVAFVPMIVGMLWYGPLFGKAWQKETGLTDEDLKKGNMVLTMGLAYLFSCFLAFGLMSICNHEIGVMQFFASEPGFGEAEGAGQKAFESVLKMTTHSHIGFGHGVLHGVIAGITMALPVLATNSMFEKRTWKNIWINVGYWILTVALMGGIVGAFGVTVTV